MFVIPVKNDPETLLPRPSHFFIGSNELCMICVLPWAYKWTTEIQNMWESLKSQVFNIRTKYSKPLKIKYTFSWMFHKYNFVIGVYPSSTYHTDGETRTSASLIPHNPSLYCNSWYARIWLGWHNIQHHGSKTLRAAPWWHEYRYLTRLLRSVIFSFQKCYKQNLGTIWTFQISMTFRSLLLCWVLALQSLSLAPADEQMTVISYIIGCTYYYA